MRNKKYLHCSKIQ